MAISRTTFMSCGALVSSTARAALTARTSLSPSKYVNAPEIPPRAIAKTVVAMPPAGVPKMTYPMENPSAPSRATTSNAIRNEFRRFAAICW